MVQGITMINTLQTTCMQFLMNHKPTLLLPGLVLALAGSAFFDLHTAAAQFENVTTAAGLTNEHAYGESAAWGDYNNDGYPDFYIACGLDGAHVNALYKNNQDGTFTRMTGAQVGPIASDAHDSFGCYWADFNNDGYQDMLVINGAFGSSLNDLYYNNGDGSFRRGNAPAITGLSMAHTWAACADYDGDGMLDVYYAHGSSGWDRLSQRLYHARGDGTFESVNLAPGVAYANSGVWGDFDNDGRPDLYTCNWTDPSTLWRNDGNGQFTKVTNGLPANLTIYHAGCADYNNDGNLDIALSTASDTRLYRNDGAAGFVMATNLIGALGVAAWADYDNDGYMDFLLATGQNTPVKPALYHNNGNGTFTRVEDVFTKTPDNWLTTPWGDYNNDGFMDVLFTHQYGKNQLYRNLTNVNHWIKFKLTGRLSNNDAIGAKVRIQATIGGNTFWQMQEVNGGYTLQNDMRLNFGLGDATNIDRVLIEWPSGNVRELADVPVDQILKVSEVTGINPLRPTASLNGGVTLRSSTSGQRQWRFEGVDLDGQTNSTLVLTNLTAEQQGRYSVVVTSGESVVTNFTYLSVDAQFTKITEGPVVTDLGCSWGASWGDYDGDGFVDLFVARNAAGHSGLYRNNRDGSFTSITNPPFVQSPKRWHSGAWADFDNDGRSDLFATCQNSAASFFFNEGNGAFTPLQVPGGMDWSVAVADYNRDALLDLLLSTGSTSSSAGSCVLYQNIGDRTFTRMKSQEVGPIASMVNFGAATWGDFDDDGWPDLFCPNWQGQNHLFHNQGTGRFVLSTNLLTRDSGATCAAWGDYDNDGRLDLCTASWGRPGLVYRNLGNGDFERAAIGPTLSGDFQSASWADYDNDGFLDLFLAGQGNKLYHNNGDATFTRVTTGSISADLPLGASNWSYSALWFDYNADGALDLYVSNGNDPLTANTANFLYHNNGNSNAWLTVKLAGTDSNRDAIGAKVRVLATYAGKARWQRRDISGGDGYNGNHLYAHFGLGSAKKVSTLRIEWPSGTVQELANVATNQFLTIWEPPYLTAATNEEGDCELSVIAEPNRPWRLEASTDLVEWRELTTITSSTPNFYYSDRSGMNCRFYRVNSP